MQDSTGETESAARAAERPTEAPVGRSHASDLPAHIGRYRILEQMGEGGMGVVYKAEQREPVRRVVALKVIKLGMDTKDVIARFEAERQALALMSHPNVAKVFEAGMTEQGRPFFAMEYVPGVPLTDYCDRNTLTTCARLELFIAVCQAVQHAHQKGIIHRDLKPGNILVAFFEGKPVPKVIDFGIAKATNQALTERTLNTQTGALIGTPEYMSPEQAQTSGLDVDTRTDIYSLGVILYQLLTGDLPFDTQTLRKAGLDAMARMIRETEPGKPSTRLSLMGRGMPSSDDSRHIEAARRRGSDPRGLERELRGDLDWITLKAMEKDRTRRYETATDLAADIRRYLEDEPIAARPPSTLYRLRKVVRRHKFGVAAAAAVILSLLLGVIGTSIALVRARAASENAQREKIRALTAERVAVEQRETAVQQRASAMENDARANNSIAHLLQDKGDYTAAEPLSRRALAVYQQLRGPEHADVAAAMSDLASVLQAEGDWPEAERTFRDSLAMYRRLGNRGSQVAAGYEKLGALLLAKGDASAAEPPLRRSIEIYGTLVTPDSRGLAGALGLLGLLNQRAGNVTAAEPLLRESLVLWKTVPGYELDMSHDVAGIAQALGRLYEQRGEKAGAAPYLREYTLIQLARFGVALTANPNDTGLLESHADMSGKVNRLRQAAVDYDRIITVTPDAYMAYIHAASAHLFVGDEATYRDLCRRMLERFKDSSDPYLHDRVAKACLVAPSAIDDLAPILQFARANVALDAAAPSAMYRLCAGMAEYRAGNYEQAVVWCEKSLQLRLTLEPKATAMLFLAMARFHLHQDAQSRIELGRAHAVLETAISRPDADLVIPDATLQDWLICQIVWREADQLILGKHSTPTTAASN